MTHDHCPTRPGTPAHPHRTVPERRPNDGVARGAAVDGSPRPPVVRRQDQPAPAESPAGTGSTALDRLRRSAGPAAAGGRVAAPVVRRLPVASFNNLAPYQHGTTIPAYYFNPRPPWLRGQQNNAATVRADVATHRRSMSQPSPIFGEPPVVVYQCMLCGRWSAIEQLSVDHVTDWRKYCKDAIQADDRQLFEQRYHDLDNLHLVHNNCNASKNATALFDWWLSRQPGDNRFNPGAVGRIHDALTRMFLLYGVDYLKEVDESHRSQVVAGIVQQSSFNAFEHLMGNARITTAMGGWNIGSGNAEEESEEMDLNQ